MITALQTSLDFYVSDAAHPCRISVQDVKGLHPADIAEELQTHGYSPADIVELLLQIEKARAIEAFQQLSVDTQRACVETGRTRTMLRFIEGMEPDDRVDLLKKLAPEIYERLLPLIAEVERNEIRRLWQYAEGTAGAAMTTEYAYLPADVTVRTALELLRLQAPSKETIYYVYIIAEERRLEGIISLRDLITARPDRQLREVMQPEVISVHHAEKVEAVAAWISKYDFLAMPVVDQRNRLLGIITVDDVIDIIRSENTEDFQMISGVVPFEEQYFQRPLSRLFWNRFLWLGVLLFTSLLSTSIMELNAEVLSQMVALAFFIPMVTGTCGNAGAQSATMVVRSLALGEVRTADGLRVFRREVVMGLALGAALGLMAWFRVFLQDHNGMLACIVGSALLATLLVSNLVGALLPLGLKKLRLDPALTAGPFITTIIDAVGITVYFQIAVLLLNVF